VPTAKGENVNHPDPIVAARRRPRFALGLLSVALALVTAACSSAAPTPIYVIVTPAPTPTPVVTPTPQPTPTAAPTPTPAPTPHSSATAAATSTPGATATTAPGASPTNAASGCSGGVNNQGFWVSTANGEPFAVYCGVVPAGWGFITANSSWGKSGLATASYGAKTGGGQVDLAEGKNSPSFCASTTGKIGSAKFGPLNGTLFSTSSGFALCVNAGGVPAYEARGTNVTQATFTSIVASTILVPKS
jgi:hypothetical protein